MDGAILKKAVFINFYLILDAIDWKYLAEACVWMILGS